MEGSVKVFTESLNLFRLDTILLTLFALGVLYGFVSALRASSEGLARTFPNARLRIYQAVTVLTFLVYALGISCIVVLIIRPPQALLLTLGGSAAFAVGFALKDLAASIVAGLIVIFDRPFQVGDRVAFQDYFGDIESIGLRSVRLRTLTDDIVTVPSNLFMTNAVASGNAGALDMQVNCKVHISIHADLELARRLLRDVIVTSRYVYLEKPVVVLVEEFEIARQLSFRLTGKAYVIDVHHQKAFETDMVLRAARAFKEHGVSRPELESAPWHAVKAQGGDPA